MSSLLVDVDCVKIPNAWLVVLGWEKVKVGLYKEVYTQLPLFALIQTGE